MPTKVKWPNLEHDSSMSEHQRQQVARALVRSVGVLAGSPGTGKTYCLARVARAVIAKYGEACVAVASPTGKASVRLTEAMQGYGLNLRATTIHRLLGVDSAEDGGWVFIHNENNPLPYQFVIIDEASMVDISLCASLLKAIPKGTHLLWCGDPNQLPPVGPGAPLRDMLAAGVPSGCLTEIMRNAGTIVRACACIRDNKPFPIDGAMELEVICPDCAGDGHQVEGVDSSEGCERCAGTGKLPPKNLVLVTASKNNCATAIERKVKELGELDGVDPIWDVQVIVAVNKKSPLSRAAVNKRLQEMLNPSGKGVQGSPFRVADKVICLKNSFFKNAKDSGPQDFGDIPDKDDGNEMKVAVANGEIGRVLSVEPTKTVVQFYNPPRKVVVNRAKGGPAGKGEESDKPDEKESDSGSGCDLDLAYAISCHKSQGAEFPFVIVALDEYPGATGRYGICKREWIFTAASRAKKACFLIGLKSTAQMMCSETALDKRKTFLAELIGLYREQAAEESKLAATNQESQSKGIPCVASTMAIETDPSPLASPAMA